MNEYEKACKEYLKGCLNTTPDYPDDCELCTRALVSHILLLASMEGYKKIGEYCIKKD